MKNLGIKTRVIFLATVPALIFAIILVGYAITNIFGFLNKSLLDRGEIIVSQLAPTAEYGVIAGNKLVLQKLTQNIFDAERDLKSVVIIANTGEVLASSGEELDPALITSILKNDAGSLSKQKEVVFTAPIYRSVVEVDDFSTILQKNQLSNIIPSAEIIGYVLR